MRSRSNSRCSRSSFRGRPIGLQNEPVPSRRYILTQARADAQATRQDADDYVIQSLQHLEVEISRLQNQVHNGLRKLEEERLRVPQPLPQVRETPPEEDGEPEIQELEEE